MMANEEYGLHIAHCTLCAPKRNRIYVRNMKNAPKNIEIMVMFGILMSRVYTSFSLIACVADRRFLLNLKPYSISFNVHLHRPFLKIFKRKRKKKTQDKTRQNKTYYRSELETRR